MPAYRYVPGRAPHPTRDAGGHSRAREPFTDPPLTARNWRTHEAFLHGVDLFNRAYYWEAHETWEDAWHRVPRSGREAMLLQGLIQLAAALLKRRTGDRVRAEQLVSAARAKLARVGAVRCGVDSDALAREVERVVHLARIRRVALTLAR